jgi:hypothetical protein
LRGGPEDDIGLGHDLTGCSRKVAQSVVVWLTGPLRTKPKELKSSKGNLTLDSPPWLQASGCALASLHSFSKLNLLSSERAKVDIPSKRISRTKATPAFITRVQKLTGISRTKKSHPVDKRSGRFHPCGRPEPYKGDIPAVPSFFGEGQGTRLPRVP